MVIQFLLSEHNGIKKEINERKVTIKSQKTEIKLNTSNTWMGQSTNLKRSIKVFWKMKQIYHNCWDAVKLMGMPRPLSTVVKNACQWRSHRRCGFVAWVRKIPWRRKWQPTPVLLPGEPHGQRSLVGYSP